MARMNVEHCITVQEECSAFLNHLISESSFEYVLFLNCIGCWFVSSDSTLNLSSLTGQDDYWSFPPEWLHYFWEVIDDCIIVVFIHEQYVLWLR